MDKYFELLDEASQFNYDHCANQNHRSRAYTFKYVWDKMLELETFNEAVELLRSILSEQEKLNQRTRDKQKEKLKDLLK